MQMELLHHVHTTWFICMWNLLCCILQHVRHTHGMAQVGDFSKQNDMSFVLTAHFTQPDFKLHNLF